MEKKNISMGRPTSLYINSALAAIIAAAICYTVFMDDFLHSMRFVITYLWLFILIIMVSVSFQKGYKEIVKAGTAAILTLTLYLHWAAFMDMVELNYYYFFSGSMLVTLIGIVAIVLFILFLIVYINHFRINVTSFSNTDLVKTNRVLLTIVAILAAVEALLVVYNDNITGREIELHLILTYILHVFLALVVMNIEVMINMFRTAKEFGILSTVVKAKVGAKAAKISGVTNAKPKKTMTKKKFKAAVRSTKK